MCNDCGVDLNPGNRTARIGDYCDQCFNSSHHKDNRKLRRKRRRSGDSGDDKKDKKKKSQHKGKGKAKADAEHTMASQAKPTEQMAPANAFLQKTMPTFNAGNLLYSQNDASDEFSVAGSASQFWPSPMPTPGSGLAFTTPLPMSEPINPVSLPRASSSRHQHSYSLSSRPRASSTVSQAPSTASTTDSQEHHFQSIWYTGHASSPYASRSTPLTSCSLPVSTPGSCVSSRRPSVASQRRSSAASLPRSSQADATLPAELEALTRKMMGEAFNSGGSYVPQVAPSTPGVVQELPPQTPASVASSSRSQSRRASYADLHHAAETARLPASRLDFVAQPLHGMTPNARRPAMPYQTSNSQPYPHVPDPQPNGMDPLELDLFNDPYAFASQPDVVHSGLWSSSQSPSTLEAISQLPQDSSIERASIFVADQEQFSRTNDRMGDGRDGGSGHEQVDSWNGPNVADGSLANVEVNFPSDNGSLDRIISDVYTAGFHAGIAAVRASGTDVDPSVYTSSNSGSSGLTVVANGNSQGIRPCAPQDPQLDGFAAAPVGQSSSATASGSTSMLALLYGNDPEPGDAHDRGPTTHMPLNTGPSMVQAAMHASSSSAQLRAPAVRPEDEDSDFLSQLVKFDPAKWPEAYRSFYESAIAHVRQQFPSPELVAPEPPRPLANATMRASGATRAAPRVARPVAQSTQTAGSSVQDWIKRRRR
ncbi:hypothetical protein HGRIS_013816 [Hohenbuehelia grisea]|uniref:GATA-type domain-containing protein n=1 Tax=Hohenbuehelia grisea TaxID=104357 RepID=A0ABR3IWS3_9AGAR